MAIKILKCAVYTRKSTEHGLELEFNSLDAQREACEAYIKSQAAEGWQLVPGRYEDGAYSGGNLDRPALQQLLKDIDAGLVDVIVVYKIDRLTRSLADFAKLVEVFDTKKISFVAITQQFNTTTSMGRLTLNVLLSFAQFERELSSERVRDKIAASRKKGKWTGGSVPLGYDSVDKKLVVNKDEAKTVRLIFNRYLVLKSFQKLVDELNEKGIVSKTRHLKSGTSGGVTFTYGPLAYLLKNRTYLGETGHKGAWFPGEHEAIVDLQIFEQVQELLKANSLGRTGRREQSGALLTGILFDDRGNRMSPSFTVKRGVRYYSYVSSAVLRGRGSEAGSAIRITAEELEKAVVEALPERTDTLNDNVVASPKDIIDKHVERIVLDSKTIRITLRSIEDKPSTMVEVARVAPVTRRQNQNERATGDSEPKPNPQLVQAVVRAHAWLRMLSGGRYETIESLAKSVGVHPKIVRSSIRIAFLAPDITRAILSGHQPPKLSLKDFSGIMPLSWPSQRSAARFS